METPQWLMSLLNYGQKQRIYSVPGISLKTFTNIFTDIFVGKDDEWRQLARLWWRLCKRTDSYSQSNFGTEWEELKSFITNASLFNQSSQEMVRNYS